MNTNDSNKPKKTTGAVTIPAGMNAEHERLLREFCELIADTGTAIAAEPGYDDIRSRIHHSLIAADRAGLTKYNHAQ